MVTATLLRDMIGELVTTHQGDISFSSLWSFTTDAQDEQQYPAVLWRPPIIQAQVDGDGEIVTSYVVDMHVLDATDADRPNNTRDEAHARMAMFAKQIYAKFIATYCYVDTSYKGQQIDFSVTSDLTLTPVWDQIPDVVSGVAFKFTIKDHNGVNCEDYTTAWS